MLQQQKHAVVERQGQRYDVRCLGSNIVKLSEYQRLRTAIFVKQFGWNVPVDAEGRERDRYDQQLGDVVSIHCVYGVSREETEHLLGGMRVFELHTWKNSMTMNEFHEAGMIPSHVLRNLETHYDCNNVLELTRFCMQRGHRYLPLDPVGTTNNGFNLVVARDLTYAAVYAKAEQTGRTLALGIANVGYLRIMRRSHFVFEEIHTQDLKTRDGFALVMIDLPATIRAIRASGQIERAECMMALCSKKE